MMERRVFLTKLGRGALAAALMGMVPDIAGAVTEEDHRLESPGTEMAYLRSFADTVIPDCHEVSEKYLRAYFDDGLPFHRVRRLFLSRLKRTALARYSTPFPDLGRAAREETLEAGLQHGHTTRKLFHAAIFLTQVSVYCGLYEEGSRSDYIGFEGPLTRPLDVTEWHYPDLRGIEMPETVDGNFE
jgi:hypothetical protein